MILTSVSVALYVVSPPDDPEHPIFLCTSCYERILAHYDALGWPCIRTRDASADESFNHVCLD